MAKNSEIYAAQLFIDAASADQVEVIRTEMKKVLMALLDQPQFLDILKSPVIDVGKKKEWVKGVYLGQVSTILIDFFMTLIESDVFDRLKEIEGFYDHYVCQYLEEYFNIVEGVVYSAFPLADFELKKLENIFTEKIGKQVRLVEVVDATLLGGYKVEVKSYVYDGTIRLQLQQLKQSLRNVDLV